MSDLQRMYPGQGEGRGMSEPKWKACTAILEEIYAAEDEGRLISTLFQTLPDEDEYPDYFQTVTDPECLDNVARTLAAQRYPDPQAFFHRLSQVFYNAKLYNEESSEIYEDAEKLESLLYNAWQTRSVDPSVPPQPRKRGRPRKDEVRPKPSVLPPLPRSAPLVPPPSMPAAPYPVAQDGDQQVIEALEARLPKWTGPKLVLPGEAAPGGIPGSGWWGEARHESTQSILSVLQVVQEYRDASGTRLSDSLDRVPPVVDIPYLSYTAPITLSSILGALRTNRYATCRDFDMDMSRLFEKARRWHTPGGREYGNVLVLQRLYHALTGGQPLAPSDIAPSPTNFASVPSGPGNAKPIHENEEIGLTTYRVGTKDRLFTQEARHKGIAYKMGDYIHLINPDDPSKPIMGQIWRTFVPTKGYRGHHVTVCWYFRPEQTVHTADRVFFKNEMFKSSHFCDHPVEDVLERVACQFYVKYVRGRPVAPEYYPGWPIYICNSRYNDKEYLSIRIKNWASCIPEELRQSSYMSIVPFDRQIEPQVTNSPFLRGVKGPGFIGEPKRATTAEDEEEDDRTPAPVSAPAAATASTSAQATPAMSTPSLPHAPPLPYNGPLPPTNLPPRELPPSTVRLFDNDKAQVLWFSAPPTAPRAAETPAHSLAYLDYLVHGKKRRRGELEWALDAGRNEVEVDHETADAGGEWGITRAQLEHIIAS